MLDDLKTRVCEANLELKRAGLVILTWGNVSGRDPDSGFVVIKPSGVSYAEMRPEGMVVVDSKGGVVEGSLRPSSDTPTHLLLYERFEGIGGVAHTHSTYATAWAQARRSLPCHGTTHADSFRGRIPVTEDMTTEAIDGDYELETGHAIVRAFRGADPEIDPFEVPGVLVAGHGPFTWGRSPEHAVENSIVLEQVALCGILTEGLAPGLDGIDSRLRDKHFLRKHGPGAYYGQRG